MNTQEKHYEYHNKARVQGLLTPKFIHYSDQPTRVSYDGHVRTPQGIVIINADPVHRKPHQWWIHLTFITNETIYQEGRRVSGEPTKKGLATIASKFAKQKTTMKIPDIVIQRVNKKRRTLKQ